MDVCMDQIEQWKTRYKLPKVTLCGNLLTAKVTIASLFIGTSNMTQEQLDQINLSENTKVRIEFTMAKFLGLCAFVATCFLGYMTYDNSNDTEMNGEVVSAITLSVETLSDQIESSNAEIQQSVEELRQSIEELRESDKDQDDQLSFLQQYILGDRAQTP